MNVEAYADQAEYVDHQLAIARLMFERFANRRLADGGAGSANRAAVLAAIAEATIQLQAARDAVSRRAAATTERFPALYLRDRLCLSETEETVVWLLAALELDPVVAAARRAIEPDLDAGLSLGTLRRIVYERASTGQAWSELSSDGRLHRLALIETDATGPWSFTANRAVRLASAVLALLHGVVELDRAHAHLATFAEPPVHELVGRDRVVDQIRAELVASTRLVVVTGTVSSGRAAAVVNAAAADGRRIVEVDVRRLPVDPVEIERALRRIARDCMILDRVPLLASLDAPRGNDAGALLGLVDRVLVPELSGPVFATASAPVAHRWHHTVATIEAPRLTERQRADLWQHVVAGATEADAAIMANRYSLAPGLIVRAGRLVSDRTAGRDATPADIHMAVRTVVEDGLAGLATRVEVTQKWEDIVLSDDRADEIADLVARIRNRGRVFEDWGMGNKIGRGLGIAALISGPPGTGKTMVAELIANELGIELYRVDLAKVVSKWIGETEKHLAAVFDAAEAGNVILLFDEADALFTKRTAVSTSNDRYANLEVNYLLQRLESFTGVCILTSNHEQAIDPAFMRRLAHHIRFDDPDLDERTRLWTRILPPEVPVADTIDAEKLAATFKLSGGYIRNAALRAMFVAAEADRPLRMQDLVVAALREYEAMGRLPPFTADELA